MVIAPLDANTMAKMVSGICDNLLVPIFVCHLSIHALTHAHTHTNIFPHTHTHTQTCFHSLSNVLAHTHGHAHTHTHKCEP